MQVEATELAPVGRDQSDSGSLHTTKQLVWKTVPILDDKGKEKRLENPLAQCKYGVCERDMRERERERERGREGGREGGMAESLLP